MLFLVNRGQSQKSYLPVPSWPYLDNSILENRKNFDLKHKKIAIISLKLNEETKLVFVYLVNAYQDDKIDKLHCKLPFFGFAYIFNFKIIFPIYYSNPTLILI
jgi:hypothetical protein